MHLILLLVLVALTLFPFGWVGELWPVFGRWIDQTFPTDGWHAIGHATLFCLLGLATLAVLPQLRTRPGRYLALLMLMGVGQEFFQMLYKRRLLLFDNSRDLLTDVFGVMVAFLLMRLWRRRA